jgi:hypothetical protein
VPCVLLLSSSSSSSSRQVPKSAHILVLEPNPMYTPECSSLKAVLYSLSCCTQGQVNTSADGSHHLSLHLLLPVHLILYQP